MRSIDNIYVDIAQFLTEQINCSWKICCVEVEFFGDAAEFDATFTNNSNEIIDLESGYKLFILFQELHEITTENDSNNWNRAVFNLKPTGEFNIDFSWDQELADEIERLNDE
jgi:hypothetical protein